MDDELQEVKDAFYIGAFAKAQTLSDGVSVSDEFQVAERDAIVARTFLSLGQFDKLKAMQNSGCPGQKAAALMAVFSKTRNEQQKASAKERLVELASSTHDAAATCLAAMAHAMCNEMTDAIQLTQGASQIEMQALRVQLFLMMHRFDLAEKQLRDLKSTSDDSSVTKMAECAVNLASGNAQEAFLTYSDLESQFLADDADASSTALLNGKAVANMQRGLFQEAWEDLQRAQQAAPNDVSTMLNSVCCATHLSKDEDFARLTKALEEQHPMNPYVAKSRGMGDAFTRFSSSIKVAA